METFPCVWYSQILKYIKTERIATCAQLGGAAAARQGAGGCSLREGSCAGVCDRGRLTSVPPAVFGLARKKFRENFLHL